MKATAIAPSNIAFIKYWGKKDEVLRLPENGSISMNLSGMSTMTTVEFSKKYEHDEILYNGKVEEQTGNRAILHLDRIRKLAGITQKAKVVTTFNFPPSTGLSSSASGFAALTLAGVKAAGLNLNEKELSIVARQGSGSSCRSIPDGFVEWLDGRTSETSYAVSIFPSTYWPELTDIVVIVTTDPKEVSTTEGMKGLRYSPFYQTRLSGMKDKIRMCKEALAAKDFEKLGELAESEALEMHAVMITQHPALLYWTVGTLQLMKLVEIWRKLGLPCYFTINTGQNIHILTLSDAVPELMGKLKHYGVVKQVISNHSAHGAHLSDRHLF
jgi:diphosphomevalonate decarboxylase